jgi:hypothetical protein
MIKLGKSRTTLLSTGLTAMLAILPTTAAFAQSAQPPANPQPPTNPQPTATPQPPTNTQPTANPQTPTNAQPTANPQPPATAKPLAGLNVPVTGTTTSAADPEEPLTGSLSIQRFASQNSGLVAIGTVVATVTNTTTGAASTLVTPVAIPVNTSTSTATCELLHLELGSLDLTALKLAVHLDKVALDITAVPGAAKLLGNQLCQISGLLDGRSSASAAGLVAPLNDLIGTLSGL